MEFEPNDKDSHTPFSATPVYKAITKGWYTFPMDGFSKDTFLLKEGEPIELVRVNGLIEPKNYLDRKSKDLKGNEPGT